MAKRDAELTPEEAERVRAGLRELLESHGQNKAKVGRLIGLTGQALSQSLRKDNPTTPRLDTARRAAKHLGYGKRVWLLLWPDSGNDRPLSNFDLAAEVARREGWSKEAIAEVASFAVLDTEEQQSPMHWVTQIQARHAAPAIAPERRRLVEPDLVPGKSLPTLAERLRYMRELRGWTPEQLAARTKPRVTPGDIEMLEGGKTLGRSERGVVERLRAALMVDADWLSPAQAAVKRRRSG